MDGVLHVHDSVAHFDDIGGLHGRGELCDHDAVDPDLALFDEFFDPTAGTKPGRGEKTV